MRELYTLELARLVDELKVLEGFYIDQFYETDRGKFRIKLGKRSEKLNLQCIIPYTINRTETVEIKEEATNFAIAARKRISGALIKKIEQMNNDRLLRITLEKSASQMNLIFEMFGRGNLVITDSDMKILLAYQVHEFKDRSIKPGFKYTPPENQSLDVLKDDWLEKLENGIKSESSSAIGVYLSKKVGIGRMYVEESIRRASASPDTKITELDADSRKRILKNLKEVIDECNKRPTFLVYEKNNAVANFSICKISKFESLEIKKFESLEKCLDFISVSAVANIVEHDEEEEKTLASIEKQRRILDGIKKDIENNKLMGDYMMNNMHELNLIINEMKRNKNATKEELQGLSERIEILNISMKNKTIRIKPRDGGK